MDLKTVDFRKELLVAAQRYCEARKYSLATAGKLAAGDNKFFERIESGGGCTVDTFQRVMRWFETNTPKASKGKRKKVVKAN